PPRCAALLREVRGDCWAHPWAQPLRAARCGASLRLSNFVPDKIVDCGGRMPERTSAQPMARRVRPGMGRITQEGSSTPLSPPDTQNAPFGAFCVSGGERGIRTLDKAFDPILP